MNQKRNIILLQDFKSALLVGRANYLCVRDRLHRALRGQTDFLDGGQRKELERIREWSNDGAVEGIRQEMSPPSSIVWDQVNADSSLARTKDVILTIVFTGGQGLESKMPTW